MYTRSQEIILVLLVLILVIFASGETANGLRPQMPLLFTQPAEYFRLDLNTADWRELDLIPGIGPVLANRIIAYRDKHGRIRNIEELLNIKGFSLRFIKKMGQYVSPSQ